MGHKEFGKIIIDKFNKITNKNIKKAWNNYSNKEINKKMLLIKSNFIRDAGSFIIGGLLNEGFFWT